MKNLFIKNVLFEKFKLGKERTILICRTSKPTYWYNTEVGKTFLVREFKNHNDFHEAINEKSLCDIHTPDDVVNNEVKNGFLVLSNKKEFKIIQKKDCDVIK